MKTSRKISVMMYTGLVGVTLLKGEDEFKTFEALESAGMIAILDEDEQEVYQVLKRNKLIQQPIIEKHGGKMLGYKDHRILAQFSSAIDAVECADAIIRICQNEPDIKIRVGIHLGEFSFIDDEVSEEGLAIVSALETAAPVGCILASEPVHTNILNRKGIVSSIYESKVPINVRADFKVFQIAVMGEDHILPYKPGLRQRVGAFVRHKSKVQIALTALLLIAFYLLYSNYSVDQPTVIDKSIVVLPFVNTSNDPEQEYFSDGMTDEILNHLARIEDLKVISRTTTMQYKGNTKSVREITKELGVATALEGSIRKDGDQIRISVQLIEGDTDTQLWSDSYDRKVVDIFEVQSDVAQLIAQVLQAEVSLETKQRIENQPTTNTEAYNLYLRGRYFWNRRNSDGIKRSIEYFENALKEDSAFALAYSGLADAHSNLAGWGFVEPSTSYIMAKNAAIKALEIDISLAQAHASLGFIQMFYDWNWDAAEQSFKRAIELNPNYAPAHVWYAYLSAMLGDYVKGMEEITKAVELDPLSLVNHFNIAQHLSWGGDHNNALLHAGKALELDENFVGAHLVLHRIYYLLEEYEQTFKHLTGFMATFNSDYVDILQLGYKKSGLYGAAEEILPTLLNQEQYVHPVIIAELYIFLQEPDKALDYLEKGYEDRASDLGGLTRLNPIMITLHSNPRFQALLKKLKLPPVPD